MLADLRNSVGWLALGMLFLPPSAGYAQNRPLNPDNFLVRESDALLLDSPQLVSAGAVAGASWSSSGKYVLTTRAEFDLAAALAGRNKRESALMLWNRESRKQQELWKSVDPGAAIDEVAWLPGSESALAVVRRPAPTIKGLPAPSGPIIERWLLFVDARRGTLRPISRLPEQALLMASPQRPLAVIQSQSPRFLTVVRADGSIRDLDAPANKIPSGFGMWAPDGKSLRFAGPATPEGAKKSTPTVILVDVESAKVTGPIPAEDYRRMMMGSLTQPDKSELELRGSVSLVKENEASREIQTLWLRTTTQSKQRAVLVSPHAREGRLSPTGDAVLYVEEGGAWVRPLLRVDKAIFQAAWDRALREKNMFQAKQIGLGVMMFAADNQETLPANGSDLPALLSRYTEKTSILNEFVYVFSGGKLKDVLEPATTHLGYIPAPGGRVVLFVDGHVKFLPD